MKKQPHHIVTRTFTYSILFLPFLLLAEPLFLCQACGKSVNYNFNVSTSPELCFFLGRRISMQQLNANSSSLLIKNTQNVLSFKLVRYFKYLPQGAKMFVHLHSSPDLCVPMSVHGPCFDKYDQAHLYALNFCKISYIHMYSQFCNHCTYQY